MKCFPRLVLSLCFAALAAGTASRLAADDFPQAESDLRPDPDVHFGQLSNGLRYAILVNHAPEDQASLRLIVGAGSFNEADGQQGLAHFLAHMAFRGSAHYPPGTLTPILKRWGMSAQAEDDSDTDFDHTTYLLDVPDTRGSTLRTAFGIFADFAGGLSLRDDQIDAERPVILKEKLDRGTMLYRDEIAEMKFTLPDTLIPNRLPIGMSEVIGSARRDRFVAFYNAWYRPENMTVVAVGDFDPTDVESMIRDAFGGLTDRAPAQAAPKLGDIRVADGLKIRFMAEPGTQAARISFETITPYYHEADTAQKRQGDLRRGLAFAMLNHRLSDLTRADNTPFASGSADVGEQFDFFHSASLQLVCMPYQWQRALAAGEQTLRRATQYGFQPAELDHIVTGMRKGLEQAVDHAGQRASSHLADALAHSLVEKQVFTSPAENLALFGPVLDQITPEDCTAALKDAWAAKGTYLVVAGDIDVQNPDREIAATYRGSQSVAVQPLPKIVEEQFPYTDFGPPGTVASRQEISDLGITEIVFANGVRLNLKKTNFEPGKIDISVRIGGGALTEPARTEPGLARFTEGVFFDAGLGKLSVQDLRRVLAGKPVAFGFSVDEDAFVFRGATDNADLPLEMRLIGAYITDPGYRSEARDAARSAIPQMYRSLDETPEGALQTRIARVMANGDPRFGVPAQLDLMLRSLGEMKEWLTPQFAHGPIEIAMAGDFESGVAVDAVARTLGALPARADKPSYIAERAVEFPSQPSTVIYPLPEGTSRSAIIFVWPGPDGHDMRIADRLNLLTSVFTARLREKIHNDNPDLLLPYAQSDLSMAYPGHGTITVDVNTDPAKAIENGKTALLVAEYLQKRGVEEDELARAKQAALTAINLGQRSNAYWITSVLATAQEYPERVDWARKRVADISSVTTADIDRLASRLLDPALASTFLVEPPQAQ